MEKEQDQKYQEKNTDRYFKEQMEIFLQANRERYEALVEEADEYIRVRSRGIFRQFLFTGIKKWN